MFIYRIFYNLIDNFVHSAEIDTTTVNVLKVEVSLFFLPRNFSEPLAINPPVGAWDVFYTLNFFISQLFG